MRVIDLAMRLSGSYPLEVLSLKGVSLVFDDHSTWVLHGLPVPDDQPCVFVESSQVHLTTRFSPRLSGPIP